MAGSFNRIEWVVFVVLAVTLAPVAEETLYRGMLYNALRQRFHPILAALMQAAVFGFAHPFGLANSVAIGISSLAFPLIYEWRKTLLTPILLHAAMNAVGMVFLAWSLAAEAAAPRIGVLGEAGERGCLVTEVVPGSAADKAALQSRGRDHGGGRANCRRHTGHRPSHPQTSGGRYCVGRIPQGRKRLIGSTWFWPDSGNREFVPG